eukprot:gene22574-29703_t
MAPPSSLPYPTPANAPYECGDIELRFGDSQEPLRAHSLFLKLASPTILAPMMETEDPPPSYLVYNISSLLKYAVIQVESEVDWAKGRKTMTHTFGEWLWLVDELQVVGMHGPLQKKLKGLPKSRLCVIGQEVTTAAALSQRITAIGMLMAEFDPFGVGFLADLGKCTAGRSKHDLVRTAQDCGLAIPWCSKNPWHSMSLLKMTSNVNQVEVQDVLQTPDRLTDWSSTGGSTLERQRAGIELPVVPWGVPL